MCQGRVGHGRLQGGHGHPEGAPGPVWPWPGRCWPQPTLAVAKSKVVAVQAGRGQGGCGPSWPWPSSGWPWARPRCSQPGQRWSWPAGHGQAQGGHRPTKLRLATAHAGHGPVQGGHGPGPPKPHHQLFPTSQALSALLNSRNP